MQLLFKILKQRITLLLAITLLLVLFEQNGNWVESIYSSKIYVFISTIQRALFYWLPFSVGDVFYVLIFIYFIYTTFVFFRKLFTAKQKLKLVVTSVKKILNAVLIIFIFFKILWGLNYSRLGVANQFNISKKTYSTEELEHLLEDLILDANYCRSQIADTNLPSISIDTVYAETKKCYEKISVTYTFLKPRFSRVKPSLFSFAGSYLGYTGYYNPFSAEAQIRSDLPSVILPTIATHELAHQLGYASEDEANFIGFLAANESDNIIFRYCLSLDLIDYVYRELIKSYIQGNNIGQLKKKYLFYNDCFSALVKKDRYKIRVFFEKDKKDMATYSNFVFDKYLKINKQMQGIKSYNEVLAWILAYQQQKINKK